MKYKLLRKDRAASTLNENDEYVYDCVYYDYGISDDDTRLTGLKYISVTRDENGNYPFFTIPEEDLEII